MQTALRIGVNNLPDSTCPKCGARVYATDTQCMSCGHALARSRPSRHGARVAEKLVPSRRGSPLRQFAPKALGLLLCIGLVGGAGWHYKVKTGARAAAANEAMERGNQLYEAGRYTDAKSEFGKAQEYEAERASECIQACDQRIAEVQAKQQRAADEAEAARKHAEEFFAEGERQRAQEARGETEQRQTQAFEAKSARSARHHKAGIAPGYYDRSFYVELALYAVSLQLKAPRTASFTGGGLPAIGVRIDRSDGQVVVSGEVDAQNGFGAMIRGSYIVAMKPDGTVTLAWVGGGG